MEPNDSPSRPVKTAVAAKLLGASYHRVVQLIRYSKLSPPPERDSSGHFLWSHADLERARVALARDLRRKENRAPKEVA